MVFAWLAGRARLPLGVAGVFPDKDGWMGIWMGMCRVLICLDGFVLFIFVDIPRGLTIHHSN